MWTDSKCISFVSEDTSIRLWDIGEKKVDGVLKSHCNRINFIIQSNEYNLLSDFIYAWKSRSLNVTKIKYNEEW